MKHVEGFPLKLLWNHVGDCKTRRLRDILRDDADTLIMDRGADIVVAQVGAPLLWPRPDTIMDFWKRTVNSGYYHTITFHGQVLDKSAQPNYLFYPSEWEPISESPLILLEGVFWPYDSCLKMF
ncbi:MAG: hypothetical protein DMF26_04130 [Verrucomicrobia bacterium]|nr:MAG: hypothetical protein DMF26_04130 [Verrucomicrobiota bacterium]